jgi:diguanylate cyclase (GGDEF)-like protein
MPEQALPAGQLASLGVQVEAMRAVLVRLLQEVVQAESRLARANTGHLLEVNQQLVISALAQQAAVDDGTASAIDALTRLPTRQALTARFELARTAARRKGTRLALLFVDLDNFKRLNDSFGHAFGDALLCRVAARMLAAVRSQDMVSRHGGDEFLVLLADLAEPADAQAAAEKLIAAIGVADEVGGHGVSLSASIGIAMFAEDGEELELLVKRADAAMYGSKRRGAGGIAFHGVVPVEAADRHAAVSRRGDTLADDPERRQVLLREANERLVLAALTSQDLLHAAEKAQQRQTALLTAVAEELRNPMAPIRIASAMLGRPGLEQPLLPQVQSIVEAQLTRISRLLGGLVDGAQARGDVDSPAGSTIDLVQLIDEHVALLRPLLDLRRQQLVWRRPAEALTVYGDAPHLGQAVVNLIDNASKHTHDGGSITLTLEAGADDSAVITVTDNGIGITPQMLPHVFDAFAQDTHALGFNGVGLGIGLTIARALVRAHGGELVAHSDGISRGSRFVVTLPRVPPAEAAPATADTPMTGPPGGE